MLNNVPDNVNAFVEELKQLICDAHGDEVWRESVKSGLARDARDFIEGKLMEGVIVDDGDLDFYAEDFYSAHLGGIKRTETKVNAKAEAEGRTPFASPARGSLQNVTIYATLLGRAIEERQNLLGQREPLSYEEAVTWLEREAQQGTPIEWVDITFRVRRELGFNLGSYLELKSPGEAAAWLQGQLEGHTYVEHDARRRPHYYLEPKIESWWDYVEFDYSRNYKPPVQLNRGKLIELAETARFLLPWTRDINRGVWLILTGYWQRLGVQLVWESEIPGPGYHPIIKVRGNYPDFGSFGVKAPLIFEVRERETSPEELAAYYADIRQLNRVKSKTRVLTYVSEIIALAALELIELRDIWAGDRGFYKQTLERFESRAHLYGIDPFIDFAPGATRKQRADAVRKALDRVEQAYQEFHKADPRTEDKQNYTFRPLFRRDERYIVREKPPA